MARKVFISYSHNLDLHTANEFVKIFSDQRDAFIDRSVRTDLGDITAESIKRIIRPMIAESSVTVVLIGKETGGRAWVDWEIYNSLRKGTGNQRNGLLGVRIPNKQWWTPKRLDKNVPRMGLIIDWPRDYRTLSNAIETAYNRRLNHPDLSDPLRQRNSYKTNEQSWF